MPIPFDPWRSVIVSADVAIASRASARIWPSEARSPANLLDVRCPRLADVPPPPRDRSEGPCSLADMPIVRKAELMRSFDDWVTDPAIRARRVAPLRRRSARTSASRSSTATSSGRARAAPASRAVRPGRARRWRSTTRSRRCAGPICGRCAACSIRGASASASSSSAPSAATSRAPCRSNGCAGSIRCCRARLRASRSCSRSRARGRAATRSRPPSSPPIRAPRSCWPTKRLAGRLTSRRGRSGPAARRCPRRCALVEQAFGCPVVNSYGASEFLSLACECAHGPLHLNSDWAILEPVDERGRAGAARKRRRDDAAHQPRQPRPAADPLRPRRPGHAARGAVRLRLAAAGDRGRRPQRRHAAPRRGRRAVHVLPLALSTVLEEDAGLFDFQLVQEGRASSR